MTAQKTVEVERLMVAVRELINTNQIAVSGDGSLKPTNDAVFAADNPNGAYGERTPLERLISGNKARYDLEIVRLRGSA